MLAFAAAVTPVVPGVVAPRVADASDRVDPPGASVLRPVDPCRLHDDRTTAASTAVDRTVRVQVRGRCGVPTDAVAASVVVTVLGAERHGFAAVYPAGHPWPGTSMLNVATGVSRSNASIVRLGPDGAVDVLVHAGGAIIVDVTGAFVPRSNARAGRFVPIRSERVVDTRDRPRPAPGSSVRVPLPATVPADAVAVAATITIVGSRASGHLRVHEAGRPPAESSVLVTDAPGRTRAVTTVVPVGADGFAVYTSAGDHVVVDVTGYFTGPSAPESADGRLVPIDPLRLADTRSSGPPLYRGGERAWSLDTVLGAARAASGLVANVTAVEPSGDGWALVFAARTARPFGSSVNAAPGETAPNQVIVPVSTDGIAVHSSSGSHVVVDVTAWFTGTPLPADAPAHRNVRPAPGPTLLVGDSVAAALRWRPESQQYLTNTSWTLDVESCRRTALVSCFGREGRRPPNAVEAVRERAGGHEIVVVATGYNDADPAFDDAVRAVLAEARTAGVRRVVWVTLRTDHGYSIPGSGGSGAAHHRHNNAVLRAIASSDELLEVAEWDRYALGRPEWFAPDGVHLSSAGADAFARFVSAEVLRLAP